MHKTKAQMKGVQPTGIFKYMHSVWILSPHKHLEVSKPFTSRLGNNVIK